MKGIIVIPTFNERKNIRKLVDEVTRQEAELDILFVDDDSPDGTGILAERISNEDPRIHVLHRNKKEGIGRAYVAGFKWALNNGYEVIMQMDADLSHDPSVLPRFMEKIKDYDAVFGSRYLHGVRVHNWSFKRLLISKLSNEYIRIMLGLDSTDTTTAFKCFRRNVLESVQVERLRGRQNAFLIDLVYTVIKSGFRTIEIPFTFKEREEGESKMRLNVAVESFLMVFKLIFSKNKRLNVRK
jgi:dolichol-phosphate mannosyltransferase